MAVPPEAAFHSSAPHGLIARNDIFHIAGEEMPVMGEAVGERGAVIEHILVLAACALFHRAGESVFFCPARQNPLFYGDKVGFCFYTGI